MKKMMILSLAFFMVLTVSNGQDVMDKAKEMATYKADIAAKAAMVKTKEAEIGALKGEIASLQKKVDLAAGWRFNTGGILGFNIAGFDNWSKQANPNSKVSAITGNFKGTAVLDKEKFFWRNEGGINVGWQQLVLDTKKEGLTTEEKEYKNVADAMTLTSLFGYKLTRDIAASVLGQYNSSIVKNFNNPGVLDIGAGATWTPHQVPNLVVTVHPLNYHIVFKEGDTDTKSALGAKVFASYFANLYKGIKWSTDLSGFLEYGSSDPSLNEYTWNNQLTFAAWKGIGVGIGFGIRNSAIESDNFQSYYNLGLSYNL